MPGRKMVYVGDLLCAMLAGRETMTGSETSLKDTKLAREWIPMRMLQNGKLKCS